MTVPPSSGPSDPFQPGAPPPSGQPYQPPPQYGQQPPAYNQPQSPFGAPGYDNPPGTSGYPQQGYGHQGYGQMPPAPGGFGAPPSSARPQMATTAATLAFVIGGLVLLGAIIVLTTIGAVSGLLTFIIILQIVVAAGLIYGGVQLLGGKDGRIILIAAGVEGALQLFSLILAFTVVTLLIVVGCAAIVYFVFEARTKAWLDAKGGAHF